MFLQGSTDCSTAAHNAPTLHTHLPIQPFRLTPESVYQINPITTGGAVLKLEISLSGKHFQSKTFPVFFLNIEFMFPYSLPPSNLFLKYTCANIWA